MTNPNVLVAKEGIVLCALGTRWSVLSILPTSVGSGRVVDDLSTYPLGGRCKSQTAQEFLCQQPSVFHSKSRADLGHSQQALDYCSN